MKRRASPFAALALVVVLGSWSWALEPLLHLPGAASPPVADTLEQLAEAAPTWETGLERWGAPARVWRWETTVHQSSVARTVADAPALNVAGLPDGVGLASDGAQVLQWQADGTLWRRGLAARCEVADTGRLFFPRSTRVAGLPPIQTVVVGRCHTLALGEDGTLWAWGSNRWGQRGDADPAFRPDPQRLANLPPIVAVAAGPTYSLAVDGDGQVWQWGVTASSDLDLRPASSCRTPTIVGGLPETVAVAGGPLHSLALDREGHVWQWSQAPCDEHGSLGTPVTVVPDLTNVTAIAAGGGHYLALRAEGSVWAWGLNSVGQVSSVATAPYVSSPIPVQGLTDVRAIAAGDYHSLALTRQGTVWTWGFGGYWDPAYESGVDRIETELRPVPGLEGITAIAAGDGESWALQQAAPRALPLPRFVGKGAGS